LTGLAVFVFFIYFTDLSATLDEVIPWVKQQVDLGNI
jgi:hypothetical protein